MADGIQDDARGRSRAAGREQAAAFVWRILGVRPPMKEMETQAEPEATGLSIPENQDPEL